VRWLAGKAEVSPPARPQVAAAERVVVKVGTRVLTDGEGRPALARLFDIVEAVARRVRAGSEVLVVSSGAVGVGREALGLAETPTALVERQACAAVGQPRLMQLYQQGFDQKGLTCAQVLLTEADFDDRTRYLNLQRTLTALLRRGVVPVINENDAVSTEELELSDKVFGDNDRLSALVATKLDAELLVLLTDVAAVYERDPTLDPSASPLLSLDPDGDGPEATESRSGAGRGGMASKIAAASIAARNGCHAIIASGLTPGVLDQVLAGEAVGTHVRARPGLAARKRWIAYATTTRGRLHLDNGAVRALRDRGASLLAAGVRKVEGQFQEGEVVELLGPSGELVGRGLVYCDAPTARRWCAGVRPDGVRDRHALVHRRDLVLAPEAP
jgi:glutamate 5-kinase